jgi:methyl-accepting chemotaxis protein
MVLLSTTLAPLVAQGAVRDTVVMIQVPPARSALESIVMVGELVIPLIVLVLLGAVVFLLFALRRSIKELTKLFHSSYGDLSAAAHAVRNASDDVRQITQSVKTDFSAVSDTVRYMNKGVRRAVRRARARLERLDALAEVAQEEAEDFVLSTSSALHGVRAGAAALRRTFQFTQGSTQRRRRKKKRSGREDGDRMRERPRVRARVSEDT